MTLCTDVAPRLREERRTQVPPQTVDAFKAVCRMCFQSTGRAAKRHCVDTALKIGAPRNRNCPIASRPRHMSCAAGRPGFFPSPDLFCKQGAVPDFSPCTGKTRLGQDFCSQHMELESHRYYYCWVDMSTELQKLKDENKELCRILIDLKAAARQPLNCSEATLSPPGSKIEG